LEAEMAEFLNDPLIAVVVGLGGIVIGVFFSIFFYSKSKVVAKPKYTLENINLIDLARRTIPPNIKLLYDDKQISVLNRSVLRFMNAGRKTIDCGDFVPSEMQIDFSENDPTTTHVMSVEITEKSRDSIIVNTDVLENNNISISVNYLDHKDFFVIEILHTGETPPVNLIGHVKGAPKGVENITIKAERRYQLFFDSLFDPLVKGLVKAIFGKL